MKCKLYPEGPSPPKVMILIAARSVTGPAKGIFQFLKNKDSSNVDFLLYAFSVDGFPPMRFLEGAKLHNLQVRLLDQHRLGYFSLVRQVIREVKTNQVSIIQTHSYKPHVLGFLAQIFTAARWICFMHGTTSENLKVKFFCFLENILQCFAARTVLVTRAQKEKVFCSDDNRRIRVLHNAVDIKNPLPLSQGRRPVHEFLAISASSRVIVVVGRFSPEKGVDIFLDAFSKIFAEDASIHALLVGDGQERGALEKQAMALGIKENVHFVGFTERPGDFMLDADLIVLPSRSEGIPNVILEAMALGTPVVATSVGGVPEIIEHNVNGLLVPPERPDLLANAIKRALGSPGLMKLFSENGRKKLEASFSVKKRVTRLLSIYQEVLNERG